MFNLNLIIYYFTGTSPSLKLWPVFSRNCFIPWRGTAKVLVFTNGWQRIVSAFQSSLSINTSTFFSWSLSNANKLTEPGSIHKYVLRRSGDAKLKRDASRMEESSFKSTCLSWGTVTRKCLLPFLSLKNRFLVDAPSISGESRFASFTVKTAGWSKRSYETSIESRNS